MKKAILSFIFILLFSNLSYSQTFKAESEKNQVAVGENFRVSFSLSGSGEDFKAPNFEPFKVVSGPSTSKSFSWINGKSTASMSFSYILQASKEGAFTIQPAYINLNGKLFASNSLTISVSGSSASIAFDKNTPKNARNEIERSLFIKTGLSKKIVYLGEPFVALYRFYAHPEMQYEITGMPKMPVYNAFWSQDIDKKQQVVFTGEYLGGVNYRVADIKKVVLIPQELGEKQLEPIEMNITARLVVNNKNRGRSNSIFDDPFFGGGSSYQDYNYLLKSQEANISVKALPSGAPSSFNGAIGVLKSAFSISSKNVKQGEPISLKLEISGTGNFPLINASELKSNDDFEIYSPKSIDEYGVNDAGFSGKRIFEYIIIPKKSGSFSLPQFEYSTFNVNSGAYESSKSDIYTINVEKSNSISFDFSNQSANDSNSFLNILIKIIAPILALGLIIYIFILFKKQKRKDKKIYDEQFKEKREAKVDYFKEAKKYANANNIEEFSLALSNAIWLFISNKCSLSLGELTREKAGKILSEKGIEESKIQNLFKALDIVEHIRYAPFKAANFDINEFIDELENLLAKIEKK